MIPTKNHINNESGVTLIEALIAMVILSIGILGLTSMHLTSIKLNAKASEMTMASSMAAEKIEEFITTPFDSLEDQDADGTAGLGDKTATTSDGPAVQPSTDYTVYYNVADDTPITGSKTIRVHYKDNHNRLKDFITIEYIKEGPI